MGTIDRRLASDLRDRLGLERAVETGTYRGLTARVLGAIFENVVTIELSLALYERATKKLADLDNVKAVQGNSADVLGELAGGDEATLYYLDGHWSGGVTEGTQDECPLLEELAAIGRGNPDDCLVIDDARLFTSAPPPPHDPAQWPTITQVFDALRSERPEHIVTLLADQVIAVPNRAKPALDAYGLRVYEASIGLQERVLGRLHPIYRRLALAR
jgi:hypothetical protein